MSQINQYTPFLVYENIKKFLNYRNLELVSGYQTFKKGQYVRNKEFLSENKFIQTIQFSGYVQIEAKDAPNYQRRFDPKTLDVNRKRPVKTYIIILDINSVYAKTTQQFVKLMSRIPESTNDKRKHNLDIIVISKEKLSIFIKRKIKSYSTEGNNEQGYLRVYPYPYIRFTTELPKNHSIHPHRILSIKEEKEVMRDLNIDKKTKFKKIPISKPICIWLGANVGDLMEIKPLSESVGQGIEYRLVVKL